MRAKVYLMIIVLLISLGLGIFVYKTFYLQNTPESLIKEYYSYISKKDYEKMYNLLCQQSREDNSREDFIKRNAAIYEGIEIKKKDYDYLVETAKFRGLKEVDFVC